jgi:glycosyltransferase involved in cell wall biosynthesis
MRILHVIPYMHPSAGGPPVVVENVVRRSIGLGYHSEIFTTSLFCNGDEGVLLERLNDLAPTTLLPGSGSQAFLQGSCKRQLGESIRNADIVHLHTIWNPINVAVRQECARHRRQYVLMPHGMLDPYSLSVKRWRKKLYLWAIECKNLRSAGRIIYTTEEEVRLAASQFCSLPQGVVIPLGGDAPVEDAEALASAFLTRFPRAQGRRQLLFLGRLHFKKGLDRILASLPSIVRGHPEVLLTVAGDGEAAFEESVKREIAARGLENNVMMTGRLDGSAKWGAYACAELFLLASRQENFAITVAEAMQMGVPVVISNKVNTWPYVKEANAGVVLDDERISVDLEHCILSLLRDRRTLELMSKRGQAYAQKNLTWTRAATSLLQCYSEVLAGARQREQT